MSPTTPCPMQRVFDHHPLQPHRGGRAPAAREPVRGRVPVGRGAVLLLGCVRPHGRVSARPTATRNSSPCGAVGAGDGRRATAQAAWLRGSRLCLSPSAAHSPAGACKSPTHPHCRLLRTPAPHLRLFAGNLLNQLITWSSAILFVYLNLMLPLMVFVARQVRRRPVLSLNRRRSLAGTRGLGDSAPFVGVCVQASHLCRSASQGWQRRQRGRSNLRCRTYQCVNRGARVNMTSPRPQLRSSYAAPHPRVTYSLKTPSLS